MKRSSTDPGVSATSHEMDLNLAPGEAPLAHLASFALELGRRARTETLARFRRDYKIDDKGINGTYDPVTEADRAAEQVMRQLITERFPDHGITGEEEADHPSRGAYVWSLDPIDGTRSYICGLPTWTTLIALLERGAPVLGVVDAPCLDETYAGVGGCAWLLHGGDRIEIRTSGCTRLAEARLSTTDPGLFDRGGAEAFTRLAHNARTIRYGQDGYGYARLAAGSLDLVIECGLKPHDYNALIPLVSGAGGAIGDWRGGQEYGGGKVIAASSRALFDETLRYFEALT